MSTKWQMDYDNARSRNMPHETACLFASQGGLPRPDDLAKMFENRPESPQASLEDRLQAALWEIRRLQGELERAEARADRNEKPYGGWGR